MKKIVKYKLNPGQGCPTYIDGGHFSIDDGYLVGFANIDTIPENNIDLSIIDKDVLYKKVLDVIDFEKLKKQKDEYLIRLPYTNEKEFKEWFDGFIASKIGE